MKSGWLLAATFSICLRYPIEENVNETEAWVEGESKLVHSDSQDQHIMSRMAHGQLIF